MCWLVTATHALAAQRAALPPDAELSKWLVGKWKVEERSGHWRLYIVYQSLHSDGSFEGFLGVQEGTAPEQPLLKVTGNWSIKDGHLDTRITYASDSRFVGRVDHDVIESATRDSFVLRGKSGLDTLRRAQFSNPGAEFRDVPRTFTIQEAAQVLRYAVKPEYSYEARRIRATGTGVFELHFDYDTGALKHIHIVQSTGSRVLDQDAIGGLKEWRAKPHSVRVMRIPISFRMP